MTSHIRVEQLAKIRFDDEYKVVIPGDFIMRLTTNRGVNARWRNVAAFLEMAIEAWLSDEWSESKFKEFKGDFQDAEIVPNIPKQLNAALHDKRSA